MTQHPASIVYRTSYPILLIDKDQANIHHGDCEVHCFPSNQPIQQCRWGKVLSKLIECNLAIHWPLTILDQHRDLEEWQALVRCPHHKSTQGSYPVRKMLHFVLSPRGRHLHEGLNLLWVGFNSLVGNHEAEELFRGYLRSTFTWVELYVALS